MIIVADNGMETQTRKLKDGITLDEAKAQVRELWEDDWLGLCLLYTSPSPRDTR